MTDKMRVAFGGMSPGYPLLHDEFPEYLKFVLTLPGTVGHISDEVSLG